jgi:hypothetical protein
MEKVSALLLLALCACGDVEGLKSEDIFGLSPNPKVWLYGQVTNARTGAPLGDVAIAVGGQSTSSDHNGAFRLDGLEAAEISGSASAHGFKPYQLVLALRPGANARNIVLEPQECGRSACTPEEFCDAATDTCVMGATLTGGVADACTHQAIDARITIDSKSTCSSALSGKTYFELHGLRPGGPQTLSVGKVNYEPLNRQLTLVSGFNAVDMIPLMPLGGCGAAPPENVPCSCTQAWCQ